MSWEALENWWKQPFNAQASASGWILFTGFVLIVIYLWTRVLHEAGHVVGETV
jgi:hypothetical protein